MKGSLQLVPCRKRGLCGDASAQESGTNPYCIRIFGRSYLRGRKLKVPALAFLVLQDLVLAPFFRRENPPPLRKDQLSGIAICKLDHLGDLLMITPLLEALRRNLPHAEVTVVVGSWCRELAAILQRGGMITHFACLSALALDKRRKNFFVKVASSLLDLASVARILRGRRLDLFVDLRPYFPCAWLLAVLSRAKVRAGFGLRGMSQAYHVILPFSADKPLGQAYLDALPGIAGAGLIYRKPILPSMSIGNEIIQKFQLPPRYIAVQLSSREKSRNVPFQIWRKVLLALNRSFSIALLGVADDQRHPELERLEGISCLVGRTSIEDCLGIVENSIGVVSVDSLAAHLGLAYSLPVAVLMVEPYSQRRSYPEDCPHLGLFSAGEGVEHAVEAFFASQTWST